MALEQTYDLTDVRVEQATMLKQRALASCVFVFFIICNYAIILVVTEAHLSIAIWFVLASIMVLVTYVYAQRMAPNGVNRDNVAAYLRGHIAICGLTGAIWGGFAIYFVDWNSTFSLFIVTFMVSGITIGGMLPSSAYRPGYVGLATFALVPHSVCILFGAPWPISMMGVATLVYFAFGMITSARAEKDMRESIVAKHTRVQTEKIRAENTIARRVNEEKTRFLSATSHDLAQPLHAQGYFIQALKEKVIDPAEAALVEKIEQTWRKQSQFLKGLVEINRIDSGAITPKIQTVDLVDELTALLDEFDNYAREKTITLTSHFEPCQCETDPVLLNRIVRNILSNAIKYTPKCGVINLKLSRTDTATTLIIEDNGIGIAEDQLNHVFKEYVQLANDDEKVGNGVGLGLSIVKKLAHLLNIDIDLASSPGKGTSFTLSLPAAHASLSTAEAEHFHEHGNAVFKETPLVIIVDDDGAIREAMANLLTDWGCQLITASTASEALILLSETEEIPTLLLIDKWLAQKQNGIDLIEQLREEVNEETPAILMSGDPEGLGDRTDLENVTYLSKPVEPAAIRRHLQDAIHHKSII